MLLKEGRVKTETDYKDISFYKKSVDTRIESLKAELEKIRIELHKDIDEQFNDIR